MLTETATPLRIEPIDRLESIEEDWSALAAASRNVFDTPEWASLWWRHFGRDRELAVAAARDATGAVAAILPLYVWRTRPGRVLRFLGHGLSDQLGPICREGDPARLDALRAYLDDRRGDWDVFLGENLPGEERWPAALGARVLRIESNPVLADEGGGWDGFLAARTSHFRKQLAKRERVLAREHRVSHRLADDPDRLDADLDLLFALHEARWGARSPFLGDRAAFHREFARRAFERGWLRLWFLEVDGHPAATLYGFRFGDVECCYQSGRDPAWDRFSAGFLLFAHSIRTALEEGMTEYRFLRGDDPWKARFATRDHGLDTVALASGPRGRALVAAAGALRASARVRKRLRAPLEA